MFARVKDFVSRHRRKLIVTSVIIGGSMLAIKYAQRKLYDFQERQAREFFEKSRRMAHFESTERTSNQVIVGMGAELTQAILRECNTDAILEKLRQNPANKLELWEELKIVTFTRLTTLIYASSMLVVALRIQMNVLGGYLYRDIVSEQRKEMTDELKQQYLSLIRYFIHEDGLRELIKVIRERVLEVLESLELTKVLCLADLEQYFWSIQMSLNSDPHNDPTAKMSKYLMPAQLNEYNTGAGPLLQQMHSETLDLLESDDAVTICANNIARGFSLATDAIAEALGETVKQTQQQNNNAASVKEEQSSTPSTSDDQKLQPPTSTQQPVANNFNINNVHIALAKIIPIVCSITSQGFNCQQHPHNLATSLISFYVVAEKNKILGANVYETFSSSTTNS